MPYINITITNEEATKAQKKQLIEGTMQLLLDVLGINPKPRLWVSINSVLTTWG